MPAVVLENIRSAYNVWNIIRTADAFGFDVILSWYTPSPFENLAVCKTSLWAEKSVFIQSFWNPKEALNYVKNKYHWVIAAELTLHSQPIQNLFKKDFNQIAIVFGNEVKGVLPETLEFVNQIYHIPMVGQKESLNVGQAAAIFMWEIWKKFNQA